MASQASYLYTWESTNFQAPRNLNFFMEFEEDVVNSGSYSLSLDSNDFKSNFPWPDLGLISFGIGFNNNYYLGSFTRDSAFQQHVSLDLDLTFGSNREISGSFSTLGFITQIAMNSQDGVFTVNEFKSDAFMMNDYSCGALPQSQCFRGVFRQTEIPEPGTLALFGAGLLAASRIRRREAL
jgi:hypothetical protein